MTESQRKNAESQRKLPDREKVIRGLECMTDLNPCRLNADCRKSGCVYAGTDCELRLMQDSLTLLREQEPIRRSEMYFCGDCKTAIARTMNYCHKCGRKVKWNG